MSTCRSPLQKPGKSEPTASDPTAQETNDRLAEGEAPPPTGMTPTGHVWHLSWLFLTALTGITSRCEEADLLESRLVLKLFFLPTWKPLRPNYCNYFHYQLILIDFCSIKCRHSFLESKEMSSRCQDINVTISSLWDEEEQQILSVKELERGNVWRFKSNSDLWLILSFFISDACILISSNWCCSCFQTDVFAVRETLHAQRETLYEEKG